MRTSTGAVKGTYAYMSPEQLRGEKVDRRADVWALGAVLWETLAQRHLFKRDTEFLTFQAITSDPIPDICELRPDVPPLLGDTIARAVSRDREQRFASARALGEALHQAVAPLGGPLGTAAVSDEIARAFAEMMEEQKRLLEMARAGDTFDLDRSDPLGGRGTAMSTTPVSNIRGKLEAAQAEVAQYVHAQRAIRSLEDDDPSRSGFTPPPSGEGLYLREAAPRRRRSSIEPVAPVAPVEPEPSGIVVARSTSRPRSAQPELPALAAGVRASRLPWMIAVVAVVAIAAAAVMYVTEHRGAAQPPAVTTSPVVLMQNTPPPVDAAPRIAEVARPADAALPAPEVAPAVDAAVAEAVKSDTHEAHAAKSRPVHVKKHEPVRIAVHEHDKAGPPGFITIDSTPVYAVIYIDGKKYGETPLVHIAVPPGKHAVRAVSPSGAARTVSISIESGKTAPVRRIEW